MSGKGDTPRPIQVDAETYSANWDAIFKPKEDAESPAQPQPE